MSTENMKQKLQRLKKKIILGGAIVASTMPGLNTAAAQTQVKSTKKEKTELVTEKKSSNINYAELIQNPDIKTFLAEAFKTPTDSSDIEKKYGQFVDLYLSELAEIDRKYTEQINVILRKYAFQEQKKQKSIAGKNEENKQYQANIDSINQILLTKAQEEIRLQLCDSLANIYAQQIARNKADYLISLVTDAINYSSSNSERGKYINNVGKQFKLPSCPTRNYCLHTQAVAFAYASSEFEKQTSIKINKNIPDATISLRDKYNDNNAIISGNLDKFAKIYNDYIEVLYFNENNEQKTLSELRKQDKDFDPEKNGWHTKIHSGDIYCVPRIDRRTNTFSYHALGLNIKDGQVYITSGNSCFVNATSITRTPKKLSKMQGFVFNAHNFFQYQIVNELKKLRYETIEILASKQGLDVNYLLTNQISSYTETQQELNDLKTKLDKNISDIKKLSNEISNLPHYLQYELNKVIEKRNQEIKELNDKNKRDFRKATNKQTDKADAQSNHNAPSAKQAFDTYTMNYYKSPDII